MLELTVTNMTDAHHPFHLHGFSIQPIDLTKPASPTYTFPYREFRDNVDVPARLHAPFRVRLDDRPLMDGTTPGGGLGRWVFHCHIFFHAVLRDDLRVRRRRRERQRDSRTSTRTTRRSTVNEGQNALR